MHTGKAEKGLDPLPSSHLFNDGSGRYVSLGNKENLASIWDIRTGEGGREEMHSIQERPLLHLGEKVALGYRRIRDRVEEQGRSVGGSKRKIEGARKILAGRGRE